MNEVMNGGAFWVLGFVYGCLAGGLVAVNWRWLMGFEEKPKEKDPLGDLPCAWLNRPKQASEEKVYKYKFGRSKRIGMSTKYGVFDWFGEEVVTDDSHDEAERICEQLNWHWQRNKTTNHNTADLFIDVHNPRYPIRKSERDDLIQYKHFVHSDEASVRELAAIIELGGGAPVRAGMIIDEN